MIVFPLTLVPFPPFFEGEFSEVYLPVSSIIGWPSTSSLRSSHPVSQFFEAKLVSCLFFLIMPTSSPQPVDKNFDSRVSLFKRGFSDFFVPVWSPLGFFGDVLARFLFFSKTSCSLSLFGGFEDTRSFLPLPF